MKITFFVHSFSEILFSDLKDDINEYIGMFEGAAKQIRNNSRQLPDGRLSNFVQITGNFFVFFSCVRARVS